MSGPSERPLNRAGDLHGLCTTLRCDVSMSCVRTTVERWRLADGRIVGEIRLTSWPVAPEIGQFPTQDQSYQAEGQGGVALPVVT